MTSLPLPPGWHWPELVIGPYLAGFLAAATVLVYEGYRQRYPWRPWLLLIAGTWLLFMLSGRVLADLWPSHPAIGRLSPEARTILGGLLGGSFALALLRRVLSFDRRAADAFAIPFTLGLGVQATGALLAAVGPVPTFADGVHVFGTTTLLQTAGRLWPATQLHPVMAAQAGLAGLILLGLWLIRHRRGWLLVPGNAWLLAVALFAAGRFVLEFWHGPNPSGLMPGTWLGLKLVQWALLLTAAALTTAATLRARAWKRGARPYAFPTDRALPNLLLLTAVLAATLSPLGHWLSPDDVLILRALLAPVLLLEGWRQACVHGLVEPRTF